MNSYETSSSPMNPSGVGIDTGSIRGRFQLLDSRRQPMIMRCRACAELTIPSVLPPLGFNETTELIYPWQGVGAWAVNNLTSKLLMTLFPVNGSFVRLTVSEFEMTQMIIEQGITDPEEQRRIKLDTVAGFGVIERAITQFTEVNGWRSALALALQSLVEVGNALIYKNKKHQLRFIRLDNWVCRRDLDGNVLEIVIREGIDEDTLQSLGLLEKIRAKHGDSWKPEELMTSPVGYTNDYELFTQIKYNDKDDLYEVNQECKGTLLYDVPDKIKPDKLPWLAVPWNLMSGESYGRGLVEMHLGDFRTLEALTIAITEYSAAAAKLIPLVNPSGVTDLHDLADAASGQFIMGKKDDVTFVSTDKYFDLKIPYDVSQELVQRISRIFLMNSSLQRQAERVTAEEIRMLAGELEDALGGTYAVLATRLQLPLSKLILSALEEEPSFPKISKFKSVKTMISTGVEGLGRNHELARLQSYIMTVAPLPPALQFIDWHPLLRTLATLSSLDPDGFLKSSEQVQRETQEALEQQQKMELMKAATPNATKGIVDGINQQQSQMNPNEGEIE